MTAAIEEEGLLLDRPGVRVSHTLVDIHGRTYSVAQINSVQVEEVKHPSYAGLTVVAALVTFVIAALVMVSLIVVLMEFGPGEETERNFVWIVLGSAWAATLALGVWAGQKRAKLPRWGLLRIEMSSGSAKAFDAEIASVEEVAEAIRQAMGA